MSKDSSRPKRAQGAYNFFIKDRRSHYKANDLAINFTEFTKECSAIWKTLSNEDKAKYSKNAEVDKARFVTEMATYEPEEGKAKKRKARDPKLPKRPLSSFFYFCSEQRPICRNAHPKAGLGDIAKKLGAQWKNLSEKEKAPFAKSALQAKARYDREMELYRNGSSSKKKGASSMVELEPDSSSSES